MHRAERARVLDRGLRLARPIAIEVGRQVVRDADQPWPQRATVRLPQRPLVVAIGLQEGLLGQVLGVVVVAHSVVRVGVDVPQVLPVKLRELPIELGLVHASEPTQAADLDRVRVGRMTAAAHVSASTRPATTSARPVTAGASAPSSRRAAASIGSSSSASSVRRSPLPLAMTVATRSPAPASP